MIFKIFAIVVTVNVEHFFKSTWKQFRALEYRVWFMKQCSHRSIMPYVVLKLKNNTNDHPHHSRSPSWLSRRV